MSTIWGGMFCFKTDRGLVNTVPEGDPRVLEFFDIQFYQLYGWLGCHYRNYYQVPQFLGVTEIDLKDFAPNEQPYIHEDDPQIYMVELQALLDFDWSQEFRDSRSRTCDLPTMTYAEKFSMFRDNLALVQDCAATHIVYWFD